MGFKCNLPFLLLSSLLFAFSDFPFVCNNLCIGLMLWPKEISRLCKKGYHHRGQLTVSLKGVVSSVSFPDGGGYAACSMRDGPDGLGWRHF